MVPGTVSWQLNGGLLLICGALVKGAYSLISGSVSADLGNHPSLQGKVHKTIVESSLEMEEHCPCALSCDIALRGGLLCVHMLQYAHAVMHTGSCSID